MRTLLTLGLLVTLAACSGPGTGASAPSTRGNINVLTDAQISAGIEGLPGATTVSLIQRLRPQWLSARQTGQLLVQIQGGAPVGTGELNAIDPYTIRRMEYLTAAEARNRFGQSNYNPSGAILVFLR